MDYRDFQKLSQTNEEHFWYKSRRILINNLLHSVLSIDHPQKKIIEIGCGTGIQLPLLAQFGETEGLDISPESIELVKKSGFSGKVFNIETEYLEDNSADIIACFDVLEHLKDDKTSLAKINIALKSGGFFFFSVPAVPIIFGQHDKATGHYRRYSPKKIKKLIKDSGLELKMIHHWNSWLFPAIFLLRLTKRIINPKDKAESETKPLPNLLNNILYRILAAETNLSQKGFTLPWGLSLYGYAIKK